MEKQEFKELAKGLITFLEHKNLITLISSEEVINNEIDILFINCEGYNNDSNK